MNRFSLGSWFSKVDFCSKSSGFPDFENTVDRGSVVKFGAESGLCLS